MKCDYCGGKSSWGMVIIRDSSGLEHHYCRGCHNEVMSLAVGVDNFTDFIKTYQVNDANGNVHIFEIDKEIFGLGIKWIAYEIRNGEVEGYQFMVYSELGNNPIASLQKLYNKINKGLSKIYVVQEKIEGRVSRSLPYDKIVGRIEWDDDSNGEVPKIVIDGKTYTWHEVGKMIMGYEGYNLMINVHEMGMEEDNDHAE